MPKVDGHPQLRHVADAGRDAASPSRGPENVTGASPTAEEDIPPLHVLEAAHDQERKETEELLSGFDRPGRSPKSAAKARDFVDYYAKKKEASVESGSGGSKPAPSTSPDPARRKALDVATVIVPRAREGIPAWLAWAGVAALMLAIGGVVAYLATSDVPAIPRSPSAPSAATTITSALSPQSSRAGDSTVPPPAPVMEPTPITTAPIVVVEPTAAARATGPAAPRGSSRRDPRNPPSGASASTASTAPRVTSGADPKPPPRDDFIRDL